VVPVVVGEVGGGGGGGGGGGLPAYLPRVGARSGCADGGNGGGGDCHAGFNSTPAGLRGAGSDTKCDDPGRISRIGEGKPASCAAAGSATPPEEGRKMEIVGIRFLYVFPCPLPVPVTALQ
jgi:hypothetical protein